MGDWTAFEGEDNDFYCDGCLPWGGHWDLSPDGEYKCQLEWDEDVRNMYP